jgi:hypothetical protein
LEIDYHAGGAAIATINGVNYAFVGTPTNARGLNNPQIKIFRIDQSGNPATLRANATLPTRTIDLVAAEDGYVNSVPLIMGGDNRWLVVQTRARLVCYDVSGLPNGPIVRKWTSRTLLSNRSSPTLGSTTSGGNTFRVFALGIDPSVNANKIAIVSIDPGIIGDNRAFDMALPLRPNMRATSRPGPVQQSVRPTAHRTW